MDYSFEKIYFTYDYISKKSESGSIKSLSLSPEVLKIFSNFGLILVNDDTYFLNIGDSKNGNSIDIFFLYNNYSKLSDIFHIDPKVRFFIHYIYFTIHTYLTSHKLIEYIRKKISPELYDKLGIKDLDIIQAHKILLKCRIVDKKFCVTNNYFDDNGKLVIIKDTWYYYNKKWDNNIDYIDKIMIYNN